MVSNSARRPGGESSSRLGKSSHAEAGSSNSLATSENHPEASSSSPAKKRKHRGGRKRRNRRQSFAATSEAMEAGDLTSEPRAGLVDVTSQPHSRTTSSFYRLQANHSNTSLESEALLDHRDQAPLQTRRQSVQATGIFAPRISQPFVRGSPQRALSQNVFGRSKLSRQQRATDSEHESDDADDRTPLMGTSQRDTPAGGYGGTSAPSSSGRIEGKRRPSSSSSYKRRPAFGQHHSQSNLDEYNVNNPPSVPASPVLGPELGFDDVMLTAELERGHSPEASRSNRSRDALIDIDEEPEQQQYTESTSVSPTGATEGFRRRMTQLQALEDVCLPLEGMSEIGQEDYMHRPESGDPRGRRRRRRWPDLNVLEAWSQEEKEQRTMEGLRMRKVSEPLLVGGRLRPQKHVWHRDTEDAPYRFTYFNEEFDNTIHSQTISELVQPGQTFRNLFIPDPPVIEDSTDESDLDDDIGQLTRGIPIQPSQTSANGHSRVGTRASSKVEETRQHSSGEQTRPNTPGPAPTPRPGQSPEEKSKRYGPRPAWWLDVLSPTEAEMKVITKAFGIHPLTAEDILMQEAREKVELFKHYYFINYRTFEQDETSEDYLDPVNLYVVVFREGVISFHFSMTPHPANVRRRIRQLRDYLILSPDWISYGIIDDITDAYAPLIQRIEEEVDDIDEVILRLYSIENDNENEKSRPASNSNLHYEKQYVDSENGEKVQDPGRNMLRRVGECRKKVMSLYRLLGNKADVIKGFAKRCNEQWDVAPRSEIGLYLGDIQDHIVTMTGNLSHYENLLSRAHSNYLAQINMRMNERQEKTGDNLGKLTVLGTIVLPMNVVTGIWGMNCLVPGQDIENLYWFWGITCGLILFGLSCFFIAKRVYGLV
ncbi:cora-domain-containing protein [Lindgomyces ingoldianus]|uniref:Cora-domain-containing protein n=1 Tax=Lindgomyces ingoldianus TaxID=673940 RepID=A0ACB6REA7_9PLEO|nr:cora-domain-containing protein [Lindgomyces ingoldianus]KAF2477679.1 cora-domain-containing protein [Lindgomyces ingoldianus]